MFFITPIWSELRALDRYCLLPVGAWSFCSLEWPNKRFQSHCTSPSSPSPWWVPALSAPGPAASFHQRCLSSSQPLWDRHCRGTSSARMSLTGKWKILQHRLIFWFKPFEEMIHRHKNCLLCNEFTSLLWQDMYKDLLACPKLCSAAITLTRMFHWSSKSAGAGKVWETQARTNVRYTERRIFCRTNVEHLESGFAPVQLLWCSHTGARRGKKAM